MNWDEIAADKSLGSRETHISAFTASSKTEIGEMDVNPGFAYEVRIEGRPISILKNIVLRVTQVITECDTGKPVELGAAWSCAAEFSSIV